MTDPLLYMVLALSGAPDSIPLTSPDLTLLAPATVEVNARRKEILIDLPGIPLPAHTGHHGGGGGFPPVVKFEMPVSGSLYGFRVEVVDGQGQTLPAELIHHLNLIDPNRRELFLPISRRVMAAGKETGPQALPWLLFGLPYRQGDLLVASGMLHNPTETDYEDVRMRLVLQYVPGNRPWPFWEGYPFQLDVAFPVGDKSFVLPPGLSTKSFEGSPIVAGKIVALSGHVHAMATKIELIDVTRNTVIWSATPNLDEEQNVVGVPIGRLYRIGSLGYPITPEGIYRVSVSHNNTTGAPVEAGGMGVVGGLFIPDRGTLWPAADRQDSLFVADAEHYLRVMKVRTDTASTAAGAHQHQH